MKQKRTFHNVGKLDLHDLQPEFGESYYDAAIRVLDNFMSKYLQLKSADLEIVVGKGIGSKNFINGKNPLRYYVEQYLDSVGCEYSGGSYLNNTEGVVIVRW
jgi:Smr domain